MEVERLGPLSYDVTVPDRDPSAQRGVVTGLLTLVPAWLVSVVGGWFLLGVLRDPRVVTRGGPVLIFAACVGAVLWATRRATTRARKTALLVIGSTSLVASLLAFNTLRHVKPTLPQIRYELDSVSLPDGFRVVREDTHGDRMCRHGCPTVERVYAAPANDPDPVKTMVLAMFAQGWDPTSDVEPEFATTAQHGTIFVHLSETDGHVVELTATRRR